MSHIYTSHDESRGIRLRRSKYNICTPYKVQNAVKTNNYGYRYGVCFDEAKERPGGCEARPRLVEPGDWAAQAGNWTAYAGTRPAAAAVVVNWGEHTHFSE